MRSNPDRTAFRSVWVIGDRQRRSEYDDKGRSISKPDRFHWCQLEKAIEIYCSETRCSVKGDRGGDRFQALVRSRIDFMRSNPDCTAISIGVGYWRSSTAIEV